MPAAAKKAASPKKAPAKKAAAAKPSHPTYQVMVQEAIKELKERKGASRQAMKKYIMATHNLSAVSATHFNGALSKLTEAGTLEKSENGQRWKIKKVAAVKKPAAKKPAAKKPAAKKPAAKKVTKKPAKKVVKKVAKKPAKKVTKKPAKKAAKK